MKLATKNYGIISACDGTENFEAIRYHFDIRTGELKTTKIVYQDINRALDFCCKYSIYENFAGAEVRDNARVIFEICAGGEEIYVNGFRFNPEKVIRANLIENNREKIYDVIKDCYKKVLKNNFEFQYGIYIDQSGEITTTEDGYMDAESNYLNFSGLYYITTIFENKFDTFAYCDDPEDAEEQKATIDFWASEKDFDRIIDYAIFHE